MKFTREEKSWVFYDWANSTYATTMLASIFPIYFVGIAIEAGQSGDYWWGIGTSIATFISAILAPILGAVADFSGMKKKLFAALLFIGLLFTAFCAFIDTWQLMLIGYVISNVGYHGANVLYDSFLVDIAPPERMDRLSTWGYAMGYVGGSTIPFLISIALITFGENFGVDSVLAVKLSLILTVLWWGLFSIPILKNCNQKFGTYMRSTKYVYVVLVSVWSTLKTMLKNKSMLFFILAYFFYIDGVNTVITMATAYGTTLGLNDVGMILALMITQLIAFPMTILFGRLSAKHGAYRLIFSSILLYLIICMTGFYMGFGIEEGFLTLRQANSIFWILSCMVGFVQGGIQALSRSYFGKMVPKEKASEYFGVFDIFGKFAAILGPLVYTLVLSLTGRSSFAILAIISLFLVGGTFMLISRKYAGKSAQL